MRRSDEVSERNGEYREHPTGCVGWVEVVWVRKKRMQVAILAALHEKPQRFRALPERLRRGFGSAVTGPKFPMTRLLIPKFRLVDSQSHDLLEQAATAEGDYQLLYYRDHDQFEVDIIVESACGQLVWVEIKSAASVTVGDLRSFKRLASVAGDQLKLGVVRYDGTETLPFGERL